MMPIHCSRPCQNKPTDPELVHGMKAPTLQCWARLWRRPPGALARPAPENVQGRSKGRDKDTQYRRGKRKTSKRYFHPNPNTTHLLISYFSSTAATHPLNVFLSLLPLTQLSCLFSFFITYSKLRYTTFFKACLYAFAFLFILITHNYVCRGSC